MKASVDLNSLCEKMVERRLAEYDSASIAFGYDVIEQIADFQKNCAPMPLVLIRLVKLRSLLWRRDQADMEVCDIRPTQCLDHVW
jgi:hypothetical protein